MLSELGISKGRAARFVLLPEILPRISRLFSGGFGYLAYYIAAVFNTIGLIPSGHPCLSSEGHKKYSIIKVLALAANNLTFDRKNIDRVTIFFVVLGGLVMMLVQFILWIIALIAAPAYAYDGPGLQPRTSENFFGNSTPDTDLAFRLLDLVFGVPNIFFSSDMGATPLHKGFHALMEFYSYGILLVGSLVIIYLATAVIMETAQSGVPFGKRFSKAWAPVRLILFFGLLLPTGNGINMAQYVVLNSAKLGSNLATNTWITFDKAAKAPYLGTPEQLVAMPNPPDLNTFAGFMGVAKTCSWAEGRINRRDIKPYFVWGPGKENAIEVSSSMPAFTDMVEKAKGGALFFRFGMQEEEYEREMGGVFPQCGELSMTITDQGQPGAAYIQQAYAEMIPCMWSGNSGAAIECSTVDFDDMGRDYTSRYSMVLPYDPYPNMEPHIGDTQKTQIMIMLNYDFQTALEKAIKEQVEKGEWQNDPALKYGWAGAGIWFNKLAEMNGSLTSAVYNKPEVVTAPYVMEFIRKQKLINDKNVPIETMYTPFLSNGQMIPFEEVGQRDVSLVLNQLFRYWGSAHAVAFFKDIPETHLQDSTGNVIIDTINMMLGTRGLFDMCKNSNIHPLAQLSSMGRGMVEHSIRGFAVAAGFGIGGSIAAYLEKANLGQTLKAASGFFMTFAGIGLILGFILFYVLPFVPFIYFFFAVMTWVKGIFEAMVGMPLWALAHLKIDGEGMPGDSAATGYFHILEIFLRPVAILIGFLAGILIFTAMVKVLNSIFYLVISNLSGHYVTIGTTECFQPPMAVGETIPDNAPEEILFKRGVVDEFFYTVIYTIIVYMIAIPCFKMVDLIPDHLMRWLGAGIQTFGAQDGDPADGLMMYVSAGAGRVGTQLQGALGAVFK